MPTRFYEERRSYYKELIDRTIKIDGVQKSQFVMFQALSELRRIAFVPESLTDGRIHSPKLGALVESLLETVANGHKAVVFFNFIVGLELLGEALEENGIDYVSMTGATRDRKMVVERFQGDSRCRVMLMTLKTGGVGLNLTAADMVRLIFQKINTCPSALLIKLLLPQVSGFKSKQFDGCQVNDLIRNICGVLSQLDSEKWMPVDYFLVNVRTQASDRLKQPEGTYELFYEDYFYKSVLVNGFTNSIISLDNVISNLSNPFVKSFLFLLASLGIVEIAYSAVPPSNATSIYDTLQFVRITELGQFVTGLIGHYNETEKGGTQTDFAIDDERLLLKLNNPKSPYAFVLEKFGKSVTSSLYRVDYGTFLEGCTTADDVNERIALFKRYFGEELPEVWTSFFKDVLLRCSPLATVGKKYMLRRIDAKDKRLQNVILTDECLKKHILRAENYILLIEQDYWNVVVERLRTYGYVL